MAIELDPDGDGGQYFYPGNPGNTGYTPPPSSPGSKISVILFTTSATITPGQIQAVGGPWPHFKVRVTAIKNGIKSVPVDFELQG